MNWREKLNLNTLFLPKFLAKIEGDFVKKPGIQLMAKIAKAFDISIEDLLKKYESSGIIFGKVY